MRQQPIAYVTGTYAGHFVVKPTNPSMVLQAGLALYAGAPKPLTPTQKTYLEHLNEPRSLRELARLFGCTTEGARKHLKALDAHGLIIRESRYKWVKGKQKGAWAWYYQAKVKP
jgi:DNA-binding CsgD family transcriptional regulator